MTKRIASEDSVHQIGQTTSPNYVLIVDEGTYGRGLKNHGI